MVESVEGDSQRMIGCNALVGGVGNRGLKWQAPGADAKLTALEGADRPVDWGMGMGMGVGTKK